MRNVSFKEGLQWLTLLSVALVYGIYFLKVTPPEDVDVTARQITQFGWLTGLLVVIHIVGAAALLSFNRFRDEPDDERDRLIQLKSRSIASYALGAGVVMSMAPAYFLPGNFWVLHALLGVLVVSQMLESVIQIVLYRRGF